jgi:hypothetical protein
MKYMKLTNICGCEFALIDFEEIPVGTQFFEMGVAKTPNGKRVRGFYKLQKISNKIAERANCNTIKEGKLAKFVEVNTLQHYYVSWKPEFDEGDYKCR